MAGDLLPYKPPYYRVPRERACNGCGQIFLALSPKNVYCGPVCKKAARKAGQIPSKRRAKKRLRLEVINALGGQCARCGIDDKRVLEVDHIHGDGSEQRRRNPAERNRATYWLNLLKAIQAGDIRVQVLCANCHRIKTWEAGDNGEVVEDLSYRIKRVVVPTRAVS